MTTDINEFDSIAAVGVLRVDQSFLVIQRSQKVIAPGKICFPGGTVEENESCGDALVREFHEEVKLQVTPLTEIWTSITPWRCKVHWWRVACDEPDTLVPNEEEVSAAFWKTAGQLLADEELLESNRHFLELVVSGEISL